MSKAVDDRVVSLEFDNKQFEKSVNETLKMLENLKKSLNFDKAATNLSAISEAGKKVDLSSVGESVDKLSDKFSTMRLVGLMALSNIVDGAMQMAKKVGSIIMAPFNQIKTGGWSRAMKIEDAKFALKGLEVEWNDIQEDIKYGVDATAYGLDEAAKAASQLVASGVKFGETYGETGNSPMAKALRGISGVAAMANSSYEEISSIFTTVAGQGKLMTMQMRQLESRGLNVAASMAKQFNAVVTGESKASQGFQDAVKKLTKGTQVSEAAIRDLVTKGQINFAIFSEAMDEAFGAHAKDANNTFNGALANVKAALSKIGAEFARPLIQNAIPVLNSIRLMVNAIKANMGDIFKLFETVTKFISSKLTARIDEVTRKVGYFGKNALPGITNALKILFVGLTRIAGTISKVYKEVFGNGNSATLKYKQLGESIQHIAEVLYPTDAALKGFGDVLKVIFTVIKKVGEAIGFLVKNIGGPLLTVLVRAVNIIFTLIGKFGNLISTIVDVIKNFNNFDAIIRALKVRGIDLTDKVEKLRVVYDKLKDTLHKVGEVAKTAFRYIAIGVAAIVATPIYLLYAGFQKLTQLDWSKFLRAVENAKLLIIELFNKVKNLEIVQNILHAIAAGFMAIVGGVVYLGSVIGDFFNKLANGEITLDSIKEKIKSIPDTLKEIGSNIAGFFKDNRFFGAIGSGFGAISKRIVAFVEGFKKNIAELTPAKVMLIAFSASMIMLSINANRLTNSFLKMFDSAKESLDSLTKYFTKQKTPLEKFKEAVLTTVTAIAALTAAFVILSKIPNLKETALTLGIFIGAMAGIGLLIAILDKVLKLDKGFKEFSQNMALLSLGVAAAAGALLILSKVPLEDIWPKVGVLGAIVAGIAGVSIAMAKWGPSGLKGLLGMVGLAIALLAAGKALKQLDQVDFTKIKDSWKEIAAVLIGVSVFAKAISSIGIAVFTGAIAFLIAFKIITSKMEEIAEQSANNSKNVASITELAKNALTKVIDDIKAIGKGIVEGFMNLNWAGKIIAGALAAGGIAAIVVFIIFFIKKLGPGILDLSKNGKYIKRAAVSFVVIAAAIAGLVVLAKYIADCVKDNPNLLHDMGIVLLYVGGLITIVGLFMDLSKEADPSAIKAARKMFGSLGLVILSMAAFMAIAGDLKEEEFNRAKKALITSLVVIGAFATVITYISSKFSDSSKAGFGTFAGITLLFSAMMGSLAMLMLMLKEPEDYVKLAAGVIAIIGVFFAMSKLMESISKIKYKATPKALWALIGGIVVIGGAVALLAKALPDKNYVGKVASISVAMITILASLVAIAGAIMHFSKNKAFSVTKTSQKAITEVLKVLAVLVGAVFITATSISMLKNMDTGKIVASSLAITIVVAALSAISLALLKFSKGVKVKDIGSTLIMLGSLTVIFMAIAATIGILSNMDVDPLKALKMGASIELLLVGLVGVMKVLSMISLEGAKALLAIPMLLGLTAIFTVIGLVIATMVKIGTDAMSALKIGASIELLLLGLVGIMYVCSLVSLQGAVALLAIPMLLGLTVIFGALGVIVGIMVKLGTDAYKALTVGASIELLLLGLVGIMGVLGMMAPLGAASLASLVSLTTLVAIFGALSIVVGIIGRLNINSETMQKAELIKSFLLSLVGILSILSMLSLGAVGMVTGVLSLGALIAELAGLVIVLKQVQDIDTNAVSEGLSAVAQALDLLAVGAAAAALLAPGILVLSTAVVALGVGCLAAGAGVLLFANGIAKLASTTPGQLNQMIVTVNAFFVTIGQSIAAGMRAITQGVIDSLTSLRLAAVNIARGFFPDLVQALFSGASGASGAAAKSGAMVSQAWVNGFRIPVGWHSPPEIIIKFFKDTINAVANEGVPLSQAMAENGKVAAASFAQEFSGYDISSITKGAGLDAINGLTNGVNAGQPGLLAEVNETLGIMNLLGNGMESYNHSLDDFEYQLRTKVGQAQRAYSAAVNQCDRDASGATKSQKAYNQECGKTKEALDEATKKLDDYHKSLDKSKKGTYDLGEALNGLGKSAGGAGGQVKDLQSSLQSTLESQMNIFSKFEQKTAMSKEELLNNMRSQIEGMTNWAAQMQQLATLGIDKGLYQKLAEMGPQGAEYVGAFAQMTAEEMAQANAMWAQSLVLPGQTAAMVTGSWAGISGDMVAGLSKGWTDSFGQFHTAALLSSQDLQQAWCEDNGIHSPSTVYMEFGQYMVEGLAQGMKNLEQLPSNILRAMGAKMLSTAREAMASSKYYPIGAGIVEGLNAGIDSRKRSIYSNLEEIANKVESTMRKALEVNSPSKRMIPIGSGITEGLAVGVDRGYSVLESSLYTVGDMAVSQMKMTIANISTMVADGIEDPVITPVLDLSNVQAGARTLSNMLSANSAASAHASFENLQNGEYVGSGNIVFNQINNSPKALSRIDIYRDTRNLFAQARGALS